MAPIARSVREERHTMVTRPPSLNAYQFVVVSALRAHQLMDGCVPLMSGDHKATTMAQMEVSAGKVARVDDGSIVPVNPQT